MKHVKATGLSSVFHGLDPVVFTEDAIKKGVNNNSIIYITCGPDDVDYFGIQFVEGSRWIWTQGELYGNATRPITEEEIDEIIGEFASEGGGSSGVDQSIINEIEELRILAYAAL